MNKCGKLIISEDIYDYIIQTNADTQLKADEDPDACIKQVNTAWSVAYGKPKSEESFSVSNVGYYTVPKLYGLMDTSSMDQSGITTTINQPSLNIRGQGVIIGFIDTGIDYNNDAFKFTQTATKITAIWDQTLIAEDDNTAMTSDDIAMNNSIGEMKSLKQVLKNQFSYGQIYTEEDINLALRTAKNGGDPYSIVASKDTNGHGTFIAGVAAASETKEYRGAAPDARIAVVKLKQAKKYLTDYYLIKEDAVAFEETDIMLGVRFLQIVAAKQNMPLVICLGFGTALGSNTGSSPLDNLLSDVSNQRNTVVVTCTGNEANERTHVENTVTSKTEPTIIELNVGPNEKGFVMEIWADSLDVLSVAIVSPSGEEIPRIPARIGNSNEYTFLLEKTKVTVDYKVAEKTTGYEVVFMRFIAPFEGLWKVKVYSLTNLKGGFNAWLPIRQFISSDTFLLNSTPNSTLTGPSDAEVPISIGAYNHITGAIYINSGRGNTTDERDKPDIVAPGVNVYGPVPGGKYEYRTGTSIAAAHVAGAAAILLTWGVYYQNVPLMSTNEIKSILIRGATRDQEITYPNNIWGYGKLNLIQSFLQMRIS